MALANEDERSASTPDPRPTVDARRRHASERAHGIRLSSQHNGDALTRDEHLAWCKRRALAPKGWTNFHCHNGATFFLALQGVFEAHFEEGILIRAKAGDVYSEPIGKMHRGHNPHETLPYRGPDGWPVWSRVPGVVQYPTSRADPAEGRDQSSGAENSRGIPRPKGGSRGNARRSKPEHEGSWRL